VVSPFTITVAEPTLTVTPSTLSVFPAICVSVPTKAMRSASFLSSMLISLAVTLPSAFRVPSTSTGVPSTRSANVAAASSLLIFGRRSRRPCGPRP